MMLMLNALRKYLFTFVLPATLVGAAIGAGTALAVHLLAHLRWAP
jgi:hypothetical protein